MKYIFICACLIFSFSALAQDGKKVKYSIDIITADSFYLVEQAVIGTKSRPDTLNAYTLFSDTSAYKLYVESIGRDARRLEREYLRLKLEFDSLDSRVKRLVQLGKTKLGIEGLKGKGGGNQKADKSTPTPETVPVGFWILYPVKSAKMEFVTDVSKIRKNALILRPDGTVFKYIVPKKKK